MQTPEAAAAADTRGGLCSRNFLGLLVTQFLGATNDNTFRWLVVPIAKEMVEPQHATAAVAAGGACLVLPYILLAAPAGYVADRFSKRTVIVACKLAEVAFMLLGVAAILYGNLYLLYAMIALMGCQSAMFAPSKYGSIPEIVRPDRVSAANGVIGLTTVMAIVAGTVIGGYLYDLTAPSRLQDWWVLAAVLLGTAVIGLAASLLIGRLRVADPSRPFPFDAPRQTWRDLATLISHRPLLLAALGGTVFWGLGVLGQMNIDTFVTQDLLKDIENEKQKYVGILQAMMALGVGVGSILAGVMSRGKLELGMVAVGLAGIAVSAVALYFVPLTGQTANWPAYYWSVLFLVMLGLGGGIYNVPLQAFLQQQSPVRSRGAILAASNFIISWGMLAASALLGLCGNVMGPRGIFLFVGLFTLPILLFTLWLLPGATVRFIVWLISLLLYRVRVYGKEHVPQQGGALLVSNHVSWIDGMLMILHCPRTIRMVAVSEIVEKGLVDVLARDLSAIPIDPGRKSVVRSIRRIRAALRHGELVGVFPEGGITRDGKMREFQPGFLSMLKKTGVPVIPVYFGGLWGSIFSFERGKFFWKWPKRWPYPISIRFGPPMADPKDAEEVRRAVARLGEH